MASHGGILGLVIFTWIYARVAKISWPGLGDNLVTVAPMGIFFGRIANFINGELWGRPTTVPWAMIFPTGGPIPRHPSQLYEAGLEGIVTLLVLAWLIFARKKLKAPGFVAGSFVILYALSRIFVEFFREPDAQIGYIAGGWLTMGMLLSLPMIALGLWAILTAPARAERAEAAAGTSTAAAK